MVGLLLLALSLTACQPTAVNTDGDDGTAGTVDTDVASRLSALEDGLDAAAAAAEAADARIADLETQAAETATALDELSGRLETCESDLAALGSSVDGLALDLDALGGQVDQLIAASGTPVWSTSVSGSTGGRSSSWSSLGSDLDLSVTRVEPIFAWCNALESTGYGILRVTLTSADGSWTVSSTASEMDYHTADMLVPAVAVFTPPEAGDYTLSCQGRLSAGWTQYDLIAVQAAGVVE